MSAYHYRAHDEAVAPKFALEKQGARLEVVITNPKAVADARQKTGVSVSTEPAKALIDTGAELSIISDVVALKLGLVKTGRQIRITSVQDEQDRPEYFAFIRFPWNATRPVAVAACPLEIEGIDCLIGRDILMNWIMTYNGREGSITISDE